MSLTQRERFLRAGARPLLAAIPVGLLLGFAGPFGTYPTLPTGTRYGFWLGLTLAGVVASLAAEAALVATRLRPGPLRLGAVALLSALPMTFVVAWTMSLVQPGRVYAPAQLPALFVAVAAVQLLIGWATRLGGGMRAAAVPVPAEADASPAAAAPPDGFPAALLARVPPEIGSGILALETEDHYLRVHAAGRSALILMRMADAVALFDPALGLQVHRRWWVAADAVAGLASDGAKLALRLVDGREVPVGRTFAAAVRARFGALRAAARG